MKKAKKEEGNSRVKQKDVDHIIRAEFALVITLIIVIGGICIMQATITGFSTTGEESAVREEQPRTPEALPGTQEETAKLSPELTGEAITVHPYEIPNPVYILPLLFLLVILVTILALRKADLSMTVKKSLTALHVVILIATFVMVIMTFDVHRVTGEAVSHISAEKGLPSAILTILVTAGLIGMVTYVTINRTLNPFSSESYFRQSKYWTGYAIQKIKWSSKKKKAQKDMQVEIQEDNDRVIGSGDAGSAPAPGQQENGEEPEMFKAIADTMRRMPQEEGESDSAQMPPAYSATSTGATASAGSSEMTEKEKTGKEKTEKEKPGTAADETQEKTGNEAIEQAQKQDQKNPGKTAEQKQPKEKALHTQGTEEKKALPSRKELKERFKTDDPLKIAEKILQQGKTAKNSSKGSKGR